MNYYLLQYLSKIGTNVFCLLVYVWFSKKNFKYTCAQIFNSLFTCLN